MRMRMRLVDSRFIVCLLVLSRVGRTGGMHTGLESEFGVANAIAMVTVPIPVIRNLFHHMEGSLEHQQRSVLGGIVVGIAIAIAIAIVIAIVISIVVGIPRVPFPAETRARDNALPAVSPLPLPLSLLPQHGHDRPDHQQRDGHHQGQCRDQDRSHHHQRGVGLGRQRVPDPLVENGRLSLLLLLLLLVVRVLVDGAVDAHVGRSGGNQRRVVVVVVVVEVMLVFIVVDGVMLVVMLVVTLASRLQLQPSPLEQPHECPADVRVLAHATATATATADATFTTSTAVGETAGTKTHGRCGRFGFGFGNRDGGTDHHSR
mmetsp:Transcript_28977/g.68057  ORF Transcript_28977/g.68057 Transcript_28977/m.68057 type:complete len:317 (-) Transcript_28977:203-1153(-)